jgi:hypothetical protein
MYQNVSVNVFVKKTPPMIMKIGTHIRQTQIMCAVPEWIPDTMIITMTSVFEKCAAMVTLYTSKYHLQLIIVIVDCLFSLLSHHIIATMNV